MSTQSPAQNPAAALGPELKQPEGFPGGITPRRVPPWLRVFPFFTSAIFFMSGLFAVFAPIPLLILNLRNGRSLGLLAVLTNCALVYLSGGPMSLSAYFVFVVVLATALAELLRAGHRLETAAALTFVSMVVAAALLVGGFAHIHHVNAFAEVKTQILAMVDLLAKNAPQGALSNPQDLDDWKEGVLLEFPSAIAVFTLVMVWANLVAALRVNPNGIREKLGLDGSYFKKWRSPEWLVWPTIATGVFLVVDAGPASGIALNVFKFLMAIYTIHGLCILSFFFDLWNVRGLFRAAGYMVSIFVMMPLLLSLGFFDLWFDFRAKFAK